MNPTDFERKMRSGECFHSLRLMPGAWCVVRVDGRSFSRFTESRFAKPYDERFRDCMIEVCKALMTEMQGIYAFTESDEASILFPPNWQMFDRELEKIVSISAGLASAAFTQACGEPAHFDSRIWLGANVDAVVDYFMWRHFDTARCCLNGWVYWTLRNAGEDVASATAQLERKSTAWKNEVLFQHGINFNEIPLWQKRGLGFLWEEFEKEGVNPVTNEPTTTVRRRIKVDDALPMKEQYAAYVRDLCNVG